MRDTVFILCRSKKYKASSGRLADLLREQGVRVRRVTRTYQTDCAIERCKAVLNYGVSTVPTWAALIPSYVPWYNTPATVARSANKKRMTLAFQEAGVPHLSSTFHREVAEEWLQSGLTVVSRTKLTGCRGAGIVLSPPDSLPSASLYTGLYTGSYVREYRVYIAGDNDRLPFVRLPNAVDITEKRRWNRARLEAAGIDRESPYTKLIRTNKNGWVFARNTMDATPEHQEIIKELAMKAARAIDMRLGAVDIIVRYTDRREDGGRGLLGARVIETNTSVGLTSARTPARLMAEAIAREMQA